MVILARRLFTNFYHDDEFACFSLVPQIPPDATVLAPYHPQGPKGAPTPVFHPDYPTVNQGGWYSEATLALIDQLQADESLSIDPDRVYITGFSYGGKACWEFLKAAPGRFAAAMSGGGWAIGMARSYPTKASLAQLKQEIRTYRHVPVIIFAGDQDTMRHASKAHHEQIVAQGGKSTYVEIPGASHVASGGRAWANRRHVAWLFEQNRKRNAMPADSPQSE